MFHAKPSANLVSDFHFVCVGQAASQAVLANEQVQINASSVPLLLLFVHIFEAEMNCMCILCSVCVCVCLYAFVYLAYSTTHIISDCVCRWFLTLS